MSTVRMTAERSGAALCAGFLFSLVALATSPTAVADAVDVLPYREISGPNVTTVNSFGSHVAAWGPWLFVSAPRERSSRGLQDGAVYVYRRAPNGQFELSQKISSRQVSAGPPGPGDRFGAGVAAAGGQLLIGVANGGGPSFAGAVDVYALNPSTGWQWTGQTLASPTPLESGAFGGRTDASHVALDSAGRLAVIGEPVNSFGPNDNRAFHVFRRHGAGSWQYLQRIAAPADSRGFTTAFADKVIELDAGYYVVSANVNATDPAATFGQIHVFGPDCSGGALSGSPLETVEVEVPLEQSAHQGLGTAFAYAAGQLVVADPTASVSGIPAAGALRVYRFTPCAGSFLELESIVDNPEPVASAMMGESFGSGSQSVAYDGHRLAVGSAATAGDVAGVTNQVLVFERSGDAFVLRARLIAPDADATLFGQSVTIIGREVLVGDVGPTGFERDGKLLFYELPP